MAPKYQIFISSTYEDLRNERDEVIRAVLEMGHIPVGMEMFSAADEEQWKIIARHIDESDYYLVVVAHRYGSITDGISYTRKEYEYALSQRVSVLGFIIEANASWPANRIDSGDPKRGLLGDFKAKIAEKPVGYWTSAEDLHSKCSIALMKAFTASPRDGWVRASSTIGPEVTAELSRLSAENAHLREQLQAAERESEADRAAALRKVYGTLNTNKRQLNYRYNATAEWEPPVEITLAVIFQLVAASLLVETSVKLMASTLALNIKRDSDRGFDIVPMNQVQDILSDLLTLELAHPSSRKHSVHDKEEYWCLTDLGRELLKFVRRYEIEQPKPAAKSMGPAGAKEAGKTDAPTDGSSATATDGGDT